MKVIHIVLRVLIVFSFSYTPLLSAAPVDPAVPDKQPPDKQQKIVLPLSTITKQPFHNYSYSQLRERFNQFKHVPFDKSGYNMLMLPFRFKSDNPKDDNREAMAFSFLLSNALDWGEANYCTRHAYFVFKRSEEVIKPLTKKYYRNYIGYLVRDWNTTGAIGGILKKSDQGFTCSVFMYDSKGNTTWKKSYEKPMEYFELLGQTATDILRHLGEKVSPELEKLLKHKRCKDHQSILDLGDAAFVEEKSKQEFGLYKKILTRDPDFAEVRYWWSNQQYWVDNDKANDALETARAFESYPVEEAFRCFKPHNCPSEELVEKSKKWPSIIEKLLGNDSYILLNEKLSTIKYGELTPELFNKLIRIAGKYPNQYWYLYKLTSQCVNIDDYYLAMSICLAAIYNNYITGTSTKNEEEGQLGFSARCLGYNDIAVQFLKPVVDKYVKDEDYSEIAWEACRLGYALRDMGHYKLAATYFIYAFMGYKEGDHWERWSLSEAAFCALMGGNDELLKDILDEHKNLLKQTGMLYIIDSYKEILSGNAVNMSELEKKVPTDINRKDVIFSFHQYLLYTQLELLQKCKKPKYRKLAGDWAADKPHIRLIWYIFDRYDRLDPKPESSCFYEVLEWLHGNDPLVQNMVADFRKRGKFIDPPSAKEIIEKLKNYPVQKWPLPLFPKFNKQTWPLYLSFPIYAIQARIYRLIEAKQFDTAEELAGRFLSMTYTMYLNELHGQARQFIYMIQDAKQKHAATTSRPATVSAK